MFCKIKSSQTAETSRKVTLLPMASALRTKNKRDNQGSKKEDEIEKLAQIDMIQPYYKLGGDGRAWQQVQTERKREAKSTRALDVSQRD